jgi:hypothetical protein
MSRQRAAVTALSKWQTLPPLLAAAIVRLTFLLIVLQRTGTSILTQGDTASYLTPGRNLFHYGTFATAIHPLLPEIDRTPGYPIFAVLTESLTGSLGGSIIPIVLTQVLLSLVSLIILTRIASRTFANTSAGTFAGWLFAFEPVSITYSLRIMPETLFLFLLLVAIERLLIYQRTASYAALFTSCLSLAAATYVRPVAYYLGFAMALALAITERQKKGRHWRPPVLVLLTIYPLLFAWQIRNNIETGYHGFSSIVEKNLYFFQAAEITAEQRRIPLDQQQQELGYVDQRHYDEAHPDQSTWTRAKQLQYMHTQATTILAAHPLLYLESHFKGVAVVALTPAASEPLQMLNAYPRDDSTPHRILNEGIFTSLYRLIQAHPTLTVTMAVFEIFLLLLYLFAIRGCFIPNANRLAILTLICFALYFLLISGGAQAVGRYRLPVMPELCVLAAGGLSYLANKKKSEAA